MLSALLPEYSSIKSYHIILNVHVHLETLVDISPRQSESLDTINHKIISHVVFVAPDDQREIPGPWRETSSPRSATAATCRRTAHTAQPGSSQNVSPGDSFRIFRTAPSLRSDELLLCSIYIRTGFPHVDYCFSAVTFLLSVASGELALGSQTGFQAPLNDDETKLPIV